MAWLAPGWALLHLHSLRQPEHWLPVSLYIMARGPGLGRAGSEGSLGEGASSCEIRLQERARPGRAGPTSKDRHRGASEAPTPMAGVGRAVSTPRCCLHNGDNSTQGVGRTMHAFRSGCKACLSCGLGASHRTGHASWTWLVCGCQGTCWLTFMPLSEVSPLSQNAGSLHASPVCDLQPADVGVSHGFWLELHWGGLHRIPQFRALLMPR